MKDRLSAYTEKAAYFLWENTRHENALDLWYCIEEICFFLESRSLTDRVALTEIADLPKADADYVEFVRHIAFRLYLFTSVKDCVKNWYIAEGLLQNGEWVDAVSNVSKIYSQIRDGSLEVGGLIRTERLRRLFP